MFVTVRFGDDKEHIFNPYCRNDIFLKCIKLQCHCKPEDVIDVSDERGMIKYLRSHPNDYAKDYLKARECLVLLSISTNDERSSDEDDSIKPAAYRPLLYSLAHNQDFIDQLNSQREAIASESSSPTRRANSADTDEGRSVRSRSRNNNMVKKQSARRGARMPPLRKN
ncbi:hypothetical protein Btru_047041 [Bulinus truncatus]|nr:hypothetical protein Btru_047041 [Bulinus truncatus]